MNKLFLQFVFVISLILVLSGCSHLLDQMDLRDEAVLPPAYPVDNPSPPKSHGTIYQAGHEVSLYEDHIAGRVGDILTVRVEETTKGEKTAKMKTNKTTTFNTDNGTNLNPSASGAMLRPILAGGVVNSLIFDTGSDMEFDGKGSTDQSNKLIGNISVTIMRVLSNGNMVIQGESWITINQGREYIRLSGIVRSEDIEPGNVISSQRIADARISYSGGGQTSNAARGGIITQMLFKFFPF